MYPFLKGRTGNEREQTDRGKCAFLPDEIYYDNSATTRTREESAKLVYEMLTDCYGNPSSLHRRGFLAQQRLDKAREQTAETLGCPKRGNLFYQRRHRSGQHRHPGSGKSAATDGQENRYHRHRTRCGAQYGKISGRGRLGDRSLKAGPGRKNHGAAGAGCSGQSDCAGIHDGGQQ